MAKTLTGRVASNKGDKTIIVNIVTHKTHPIYKKKYMVTKRLQAHDEANEAQVGDMVVISETRPISKHKHFKLDRITEKAAIEHVEAEVPVLEKTVEAPVKKVAAKKPKAETTNEGEA